HRCVQERDLERRAPVMPRDQSQQSQWNQTASDYSSRMLCQESRKKRKIGIVPGERLVQIEHRDGAKLVARSPRWITWIHCAAAPCTPCNGNRLDGARNRKVSSLNRRTILLTQLHAPEKELQRRYI